MTLNDLKKVSEMMIYKETLQFWFDALKPEQWWTKDEKLDKAIKSQFLNTHQRATHGELSVWRECGEGALAEIIILDQFSRNIFRNHPKSYAYDGMALVLAQEAIRRNLHTQLSSSQKVFLYMPFMHSESSLIHETAMELYSEPGLEFNLEFEKQHADIISQFGRYPHRNKVLGRVSTPEEKAFLKHHSGF